MLVNNFIEIFFVDEGIPDGFGVDDYDGAFGAAAHTAAAIDADLAFAVNAQFFTPVLYIFSHFTGIEALTAWAAVFSIIGAEKKML